MPQTLEKLPAPDLQAPVIFSYNPSAWRQRIPICVLAMVAAGMAGHMALYQWKIIPYAWDPIFGEQTEKVLTSSVARRMDHWFGIPDAALGALAYFGDAIFGLAGSTRRWQYRPWMVIVFGIDVIPLGIVSAILVFCQAFIVGQWCFLCLVTAVISLILVYMAYDEVWASCVFLWKVWHRSHSTRVFWRTFWGKPTEEGHRIAEEMVAAAREKTQAKAKHAEA
ncbi:MAG: vitamin K epoxide reductase [Planctomycetes bacterium]|nr:vitamin K epoxide reductase [Planctomycetota bacterium]